MCLQPLVSSSVFPKHEMAPLIRTSFLAKAAASDMRRRFPLIKNGLPFVHRDVWLCSTVVPLMSVLNPARSEANASENETCSEGSKRRKKKNERMKARTPLR